MLHNSLVFKLLFLITTLISPSLSFYFQGKTLSPFIFPNMKSKDFELRDLEGTDNDFINDASKWTINSLKSGSTIYTTCNGTMYLGGYGVFAGINNQYFERKYTNLPEHNIIHFTFTLQLVDSYDLGEYLSLRFDDEILQMTHKISISTLPNINLCGSSWREFPQIRMFGNAIHSSSNLTLRFISGCNENSENESFGFRDLTLTFGTSENAVSSICAKSSISLNYNDCPCPEKQFEESPSVCKTCHENCASCFGGSEGDCYSCQNGTIFNGTHCTHCLNHEDFFDVDGVCKGILEF